jgi:hypothetical protein
MRGHYPFWLAGSIPLRGSADTLIRLRVRRGDIFVDYISPVSGSLTTINVPWTRLRRNVRGSLRKLHIP